MRLERSICSVTAALVLVMCQIADAVTDDGWQFSVAPYGWAAGIDGDISKGGLTSPVDVGFDDILENLDIALMLVGRATRGPWSVGGEVILLGLSSDSSLLDAGIGSVDAEFDQIMLTGDVRYRLIHDDRHSVEVLAGARYIEVDVGLTSVPRPDAIGAVSASLADEVISRVANGLSSSVPDALRDVLGPFGQAAAGQAVSSLLGDAQSQIQTAINDGLTVAADQDQSVDEEWVDPFVGVRLTCRSAGPWYATLYGDIGGFGVGSELIWQLYGSVGASVNERVQVELGWRHLQIDYEPSDAKVDIAYSGPLAGARFAF